jgi:hypothetical protein
VSERSDSPGKPGSAVVPHELAGYQFGPLERRGLLLGLSGGQVATLGGAGALALLVLRALTGPAAGLGSGTILLLGAACALLPVGGRPMQTWLPLLAGYALRRLWGRRLFQSRAYLHGHLVTFREDGAVLHALPPEERPASLRDLRFLEVEAGREERTVGVIKDVRRHTYVGVLRVRGRSFNLLDEAGQTCAVQAWASILAAYALASSPVSRLQWLERTLPEDGHQIARHFEERRPTQAPEAALRIYSQAISQARERGSHHECLLALQIDGRHAWRQVRLAGGGDRGACGLLVRELAALSPRLEAAGIEVEDALGPRAIAEAIRSAFEPDARPRLRVIHGTGADAGPHPRNAWPLQTVEAFAHYQPGPRAFHATYHVREWPRIEVDPGFLAPLLLGATCLRTVSMTLAPVPAARAAHELRRALAADTSDDTLRQGAGWLPSFRRQREAANVLRAEQELADGHASYRFSAYVTVSAGSGDALEAACAEVEQAASRSHMELERLMAEQELAFTYTLPLCEGLA